MTHDNIYDEQILRNRIKKLEDALEPFVAGWVPADGRCHAGICPVTECVRCSKQIAGLRALGRPVMLLDKMGRVMELKE